MFTGRTDAEAETPILWPHDVKSQFIRKDWCWERLKTGGEENDRRWDGWMASPTQWTWVWASSGNWWWTGKPGMLQSMGLQRVRHDWATELNWQREWISRTTSKKKPDTHTDSVHSVWKFKKSKVLITQIKTVAAQDGWGSIERGWKGTFGVMETSVLIIADIDQTSLHCVLKICM